MHLNRILSLKFTLKRGNFKVDVYIYEYNTSLQYKCQHLSWINIDGFVDWLGCILKAEKGVSAYFCVTEGV